MLSPQRTYAQLKIVDGNPQIFPADPEDAPIFTNEMVNALLAQGRAERERRILDVDEDGAFAPIE